MLVIGLTGGIGSGKTSVANLFATLGAPIIDADVIAREVIEPSTQAFQTLVAHFSTAVLKPNGELDRAKLRDIIFKDERERQWLENLLHPLIRSEIERQIQHLTTPYCIAVIPLLLEVSPYDFIDRILIIDTPETHQIDRVTKRDKASREQVETILKSQIERSARLQKADDVIINDGKLEDLLPQVLKLHQKYLEMSKK